MAASVVVENTISLGGTAKIYTGTIDFDSSYPTGGEAIDATANERLDVLIASSKSGYVFSWDAANQKLLAYYADYDAVADGALIQVPDTTNLSTLTGVPFVAVGQ